MSKPLDLELSVEVAQQVKSKSRNCFENAYRAALAVKGSTYVQGFLVSDGEIHKPIEYSWIELDDRIVDPTLPHHHHNPESLFYFAAQRLSAKQLKAAIEEAKEDYPEDDPLPVYGAMPYEYYGDLMLGGQDYLEAYKAAEAKCRELNKPKPKRVE